MLVLFLLFMLAICSADTYLENDILQVQGLKNLKYFYERLDKNPELYDEYKIAFEHYENKTTHESIAYKLIFLRVPDPYQSEYKSGLELIEKEWDPKLETLRKDEYSSFEVGDFIAAYSTLEYSNVESAINIFRTTFIVIVLGLASIYFTQDA